MSLAGLFSIGRQAMAANQTALAATGHNIANANTEGYSRKEAILEVAGPVVPVSGGFLGTGVTVAAIRRRYDRFIQQQLFGQQARHGGSLALEEALGQVELLFNEAETFGLSEPLRRFFFAWHNVAVDPQDIAQRAELLRVSDDLVSVARRKEEDLTAAVDRAGTEITGAAERANGIAQEIARLNAKIVEIEAGGTAEAGDYRDARDKLLSELAGLVEVDYYEDRTGAVTVTAGMRTLVAGDTAWALSVRSGPGGEVGVFLDGADVTGRIAGGRIGGLLAARAEIEEGPLASLRRLMASLVKEVNLLHRQGIGLDGSTGLDFFTGPALSVGDFSAGADVTHVTIADLSLLSPDEYELSFDGAGNYTVRNMRTGGMAASGAYSPGVPIVFDGIEVAVSGAPAAGDRFVVSPLEDAIRNLSVAISDARRVAAASSVAGLPGDNANAVRIAQLADATVGALDGASFSGYFEGLVTRVGLAARRAADTRRFDEALLSEIEQRRESVSGVSLDEEAANLVRYQRAFEAAARLVKVTDDLLETVLGL